MNHVRSKAWRKRTVYRSFSRAGTLLKKLMWVRARDHVTEAKIFGIFTLCFTTSNCVRDKRPGRDKGKQVGWNEKQDCSTWHGDDQLLHNELWHFGGGLYMILLLYKGMNLYICFLPASSSTIPSWDYSENRMWYYVYETKYLKCHCMKTQSKATESHQ